MVQIERMQDFSEVIPYEHSEIPLYIHTAPLSAYPGMRASCHWHEDIEWIHIHKGKMHYDVNGRRLTLHEKDSLMVNARQMHYSHSYQKQDCLFSCILFHPSLFCNNHALLQKYVTPVLQNSSLEYLHFHQDVKPGDEVAGFLTQILELKENAPEGYELEAIALMHALWRRLWQSGELKPAPDGQETENDLTIQKTMVAFLYQHYHEKITLDEIAAAGNVSRSKCCRIFKRYMQQSPIDFLNAYRLKISCSLLANTDKNITEIALACGFNHLSYFSKYFCETYGCTPRQYRKRERKLKQT